MKIRSSQHAYQILKKKLIADVEEFWVMGLNSNLTLNHLELVFRGTVDACPIHPRDIFRSAIKNNASRILIAHNHPSHDPTPSDEDLKVTKQIILASSILQIPVIDHLILTKKKYFSFADRNICQFHCGN